jgi:hypothetical protein
VKRDLKRQMAKDQRDALEKRNARLKEMKASMVSRAPNAALARLPAARCPVVGERSDHAPAPQ